MDNDITSTQAFPDEGRQVLANYLTEDEYLNQDFTPLTQSLLDSDLEEPEVR